MTDLTDVCSSDERTVLDMIKSWPGIPAIVTYDSVQGWSVATSPEDVERRAALKNEEDAGAADVRAPR